MIPHTTIMIRAKQQSLLTKPTFATSTLSQRNLVVIRRIEGIINSSNGAPRNINKICDTALFIANHKGTDFIDIDIIMQASNEIELD